MKLSVVIPAHNEAGCIEGTVRGIVTALSARGMPFELVVVNDGSTDETGEVLRRLAEAHDGVRCVNNDGPHGFGFAVRKGLDV